MVILVDRNDRAIGLSGKLEAHRNALLHRAFSIFLFNSKGELLLQQRNPAKYHSGGLWTNTCCSHPLPGEDIHQAAARRLKQEMGLECGLDFLFKFRYRTPFENGLSEHEIDYIFTGTCDTLPVIDREEVAGYTYMAAPLIRTDIRENPEKYTVWFRLIWERVMKKLTSLSGL